VYGEHLEERHLRCRIRRRNYRVNLSTPPPGVAPINLIEIDAEGQSF
jgi:hypothetical protein